MAAPSDVTLQDLNGKFVMNKKLSDDIEPILVLQGVGWWMRKAITSGTVTLSIEEYKDEQGLTHIDIEQTGLAGIKGTTELRTLDWQEREHTDHIFGTVRGKSRWTKLAEIHDDFLKSGWLPEIVDGETIHNHVESVNDGWIVDQVWGFEDFEGDRRYVRHVVITKEGKRVQARLVYDFMRR